LILFAFAKITPTSHKAEISEKKKSLRRRNLKEEEIFKKKKSLRRQKSP
jgi:hypothetical protein